MLSVWQTAQAKATVHAWAKRNIFECLRRGGSSEVPEAATPRPQDQPRNIRKAPSLHGLPAERGERPGTDRGKRNI